MIYTLTCRTGGALVVKLQLRFRTLKECTEALLLLSSGMYKSETFVNFSIVMEEVEPA